VPSEPWWRGVALAPAGGSAKAGEAVADAAIKTASDTATMAQADTVSDRKKGAVQGTEDTEALPAG
jgi:hypothetical protein